MELRTALPGLAAMTGALLVTAAPMCLWALTNSEEFMSRVEARGILQNGWLTTEVARQQLPAWRILVEQQFRHAVLAITHYPVMMFYNARLATLDYFTVVAFLLGAVCAARARGAGSDGDAARGVDRLGHPHRQRVDHRA